MAAVQKQRAREGRGRVRIARGGRNRRATLRFYARDEGLLHLAGGVRKKQHFKAKEGENTSKKFNDDAVRHSFLEECTDEDLGSSSSSTLGTSTLLLLVVVEVLVVLVDGTTTSTSSTVYYRS